MDYILSPCSLVADGLEKVMISRNLQPVVLPSDTASLPTGVNIRRIIVFLPDTPVMLLATLQQTVMLLEQSTTPLPMLLLSRRPAGWLWLTLLHQDIDHHLLSEIRVAASDLPVPCLIALLLDYILEKYPSLEQLADEEIRLSGRKKDGLTRQELNATLGLLSGCSVNAQAKQYGISPKTFYNHRAKGLKKLAEHHPQFAMQLPGRQAKRLQMHSGTALTYFEREFIHAIHCRRVFAVLKTITDSQMNQRGLEIHPCWRNKDKVLSSDDFLPQLHSDYALMVLTAFMLREAVQNINRNPGDFYFAVNIPVVISGNKNLIFMIKAARQQLSREQMCHRLLIKFSEFLDLSTNNKVTKNITNLKKLGFTIMLAG
ncbi:EAL domain-containing protein [Pluralibacter gergoviae]